eukprot:1162108-Pelagomonas_calceolata.AAC.3
MEGEAGVLCCFAASFWMAAGGEENWRSSMWACMSSMHGSMPAEEDAALLGTEGCWDGGAQRYVFIRPCTIDPRQQSRLAGEYLQVICYSTVPPGFERQTAPEVPRLDEQGRTRVSQESVRAMQ